jgi:hypothetical protein
VTLAIDRPEVATSLGKKFSFATKIANPGSAATAPLVAHLNILTLRPGVYVDPEDWSSRRTVFIGSIPAGASRNVTWTIHAVNAGSLAAYVAVLPQNRPTAAPVTGPPIRIAVADRKTINSGGVLPLALGVPVAVGALAFGVRAVRRRR